MICFYSHNRTYSTKALSCSPVCTLGCSTFSWVLFLRVSWAALPAAGSVSCACYSRGREEGGTEINQTRARCFRAVRLREEKLLLSPRVSLYSSLTVERYDPCVRVAKLVALTRDTSYQVYDLLLLYVCLTKREELVCSALLGSALETRGYPIPEYVRNLRGKT